MANYTEHVPLKGSERVVVSGAKAIGAANPDESLQVTVLLRSRAQAEDAKTRTNKATATERAAVESLLKQPSAGRARAFELTIVDIQISRSYTPRQ